MKAFKFIYLSSIIYLLQKGITISLYNKRNIFKVIYYIQKMKTLNVSSLPPPPIKLPKPLTSIPWLFLAYLDFFFCNQMIFFVSLLSKSNIPKKFFCSISHAFPVIIYPMLFSDADLYLKLFSWRIMFLTHHILGLFDPITLTFTK